MNFSGKQAPPDELRAALVTTSLITGTTGSLLQKPDGYPGILAANYHGGGNVAPKGNGATDNPCQVRRKIRDWKIARRMNGQPGCS
jgi:hypothetical protein